MTLSAQEYRDLVARTTMPEARALLREQYRRYQAALAAHHPSAEVVHEQAGYRLEQLAAFAAQEERRGLPAPAPAPAEKLDTPDPAA